MVPEGWDILPLGEMAEFRNGLNFTKGDEGEPIKIVTIPDFWQRTEIRDLSGIKSIRPKKKVPANSLLRSGDMLFVRSNGNPDLVGRCLFFPEVDEPISFSGFTIRGRVDQEQLAPEFAAYIMITDRTKAQFRRGQGGGNISNLSQDILAGVQVAFPSLTEQRKIAEILGTWDRAIEVAEQQLENAHTQKRALMQQLLTGTRRFPEFEGQPWQEVRLGQMGKTVSGGTPNSDVPEYWDGDVEWATPTDVTKLTSRFISKTKRQITELGLKKSSATRLPVGTLLVCTRATIGELAIATAPISTNQGFKSLILNTGFDADFVFYLLSFFKNELIRYACGSTFLELSKKDFEKRSFRVPDIEEQRAVAAALNNAEGEIGSISIKIDHLRTEKKALMQQLLTGKRRVKV